MYVAVYSNWGIGHVYGPFDTREATEKWLEQREGLERHADIREVRSPGPTTKESTDGTPP